MTMCGADMTTARRSLAILVLGAAALVAPAGAQVARVTTSVTSVKVVVVPFTRLDRDSALSVDIANSVRERLRRVSPWPRRRRAAGRPAAARRRACVA